MLDLQQLIEPLSLEEFLERDFSRNWRHFQGEPDRFTNLISEEIVLKSIDSCDITANRLTMLHAGELIAQELYATPGSDPALIRPEAQRIKNHLNQGAVLLLTHAEQLHQPLWDAAESIGNQLEESVTVNVYLGGPQSKGFGLHIDHHDVLVMQIEGHKSWEVREPSLKHPLLLPDHITVPPDEKLWQGNLASGDMLYLPRGYWHKAHAQDSTSLHLTFGIQPCTGLHFLGWIRKRLLSSEAFRNDIPRHNKDTMKNYLESLAAAVQELHDTEHLELFLKEHADRIQSERTKLKITLQSQ